MELRGVEELYLPATLQLILGRCTSIHPPLCEYDFRQPGRLELTDFERCFFSDVAELSGLRSYKWHYVPWWQLIPPSILQWSTSEMLEVQAGFDIRQQCSEVSSWWSSALSMQQWRWEHGRQRKETASSLKLGSKRRAERWPSYICFSSFPFISRDYWIDLIAEAPALWNSSPFWMKR